MNKIAFECPAKIFPIWSQMEAEGFETRVVGGFVRDMIMGHTPKDMDFCTTMTPDQMVDFASRNGFRVEPTGMQHGTVSFIVDGEAFEFTTLRVDTDCDGRHATVQFTTDFEADAARRDFTFNAMSMDIEGNVHDFFGGVQDAHDRVVRFVGSADERIAEDFLRVMRFFRFAARFETEMDMEACRAFTNPVVHEGMTKVSRERVWAEVSKMMKAPGRHRAVEMMFETGVAQAVGMEVNEFAVRAITKGDDHCAAMVGFVGKDVEKFCRDMKVSTAERNKMVFMFNNVKTMTKEKFAEMVVDGERPDHMVSMAMMTDPTWMAMMEKPVPVFPVTGQMMMDRGFVPGKEMGQAMKAMRDVWKADVVKEMVR